MTRGYREELTFAHILRPTGGKSQSSQIITGIGYHQKWLCLY